MFQENDFAHFAWIYVTLKHRNLVKIKGTRRYIMHNSSHNQNGLETYWTPLYRTYIMKWIIIKSIPLSIHANLLKAGRS